MNVREPHIQCPIEKRLHNQTVRAIFIGLDFHGRSRGLRLPCCEARAKAKTEPSLRPGLARPVDGSVPRVWRPEPGLAHH